MKTRTRPRSTRAVWLALLAVLYGSEVHGEGVVQIQTSKSLPDATVAVIDPESGTSSGTEGSDVNVAPGDIILFRFNFTPVPDASNRGLNGYLTEYVPGNTEVVGMRIVDEDGLTIRPRRAGYALDGCGGGSACTNFNNLPCSSGTCSFSGGRINSLHGDTGVFFATSDLLRRTPSDQFITMDNGITMSPEPRNIAPGLVALLNDSTGPYFAHNLWDYVQVRAYGISNSDGNVSGNGGLGNTPFRYGSPVAGPLTHYGFEATDTDASAGGYDIEFNDVAGPWQRVRYPGARIGTGTAGSSTTTYRHTDVDASSSGFDLTPANPIVGATAMRVALGETRTGERAFAEVALRVLAVPIDPAATSGGGNVDCAEVFGTDVAMRGNSNGDDNLWGSYVASPACVFLKLLFDIEVDQTLATNGDTLVYTVRGKNLSVNPETGAIARLKYDSSRQSFVSASPAQSSEAVCTDDSTKRCVTWNLGTLAPSQESLLQATFTVGGGGQTSNVVLANYRSDQLPAPGFTSTALTISRGIAVPQASLSQTTTQTAAGSVAILSGALSNVGTADYSLDSSGSLIVTLPSGWTRNGTWTLGASNLTCAGASNVVTCSPPNAVRNIGAGASRTLVARANVPVGQASALYTADLQTLGSQSGFGGTFETLFAEVATIAVGQPRSTAPVLTCPIVSSQTGIGGSTTEADGTAIRLYFNLIQRGSASSSAGAWTASNFGSFGELYGGLEVRATAQAPGELESPLSDACFVTAVRACSDGADNDGDGLADFPADPGCDSFADGNETDGAEPECADGVNNDADGAIDYPADLQCFASFDETEAGLAACADGTDDDADGAIDGADPDCAISGGQTEYTLMACQDGLDNDGDLLRDFPDDPGCHGAFDDDESDVAPNGSTAARLLMVLDSSGSMNLDTCEYPDDAVAGTGFTGGDGTVECPGADTACNACSSAGCGNGQADDSRLFKIKEGLTNVVTAFGEIDYALMRFHQRDADFACPTANASNRSGTFQGGGAAPCGGGFAAGDLLTRFAPDNQLTILGWIDNQSNYAGDEAPRGLDFEVRGSGTTPLAGSLESALAYLAGEQAGDDASACRPYRVVLLTDGQETCGGDAEDAASALAIAGIPVYVIGFATSDPAIVSGLDAIAVSGGTGQAILVDDSAALSAAMADIISETVRFELCNGLDDDCDGEIDEDFPDLGDACDNGEVGTCFATGNQICADDFRGTVCDAAPGNPGLEVCNGLDDNCNLLIDEGLVGCDCLVSPEVCNGADDDCDGLVDEEPVAGTLDENGDPIPCGSDLGACEPGTVRCIDGELICDGGVGPGVEVCNGFDDDCDAETDELAVACYGFGAGCDLATGVCLGTCQIGVRTCATANGGCDGDVGPAAEVCNGADDDCDDLIDEGFPGLGEACTRGVGACRASGVTVCTADGAGTTCTAPVITPGVEICNGLDDDCDTLIDEDLGPPIGNSCSGGQGCPTGEFVCDDGAIVCVGGSSGTPEVCNALDDNCNLLVDEGTSTLADCVDPEEQVGCDPGCTALDICVEDQCRAGDTGECAFGQLECVAGADACVDYVGPQVETCDGLDNDCDGEVDDFAICPPPNNLCVEGQCVGPCSTDDVFVCPFGYYCEVLPRGQYCLPDPCVTDQIECPPGSSCDSGTGTCLDLCADVDCRPGEVCQSGVCIDCFDVDCPDGQDCVADDLGVGACEPDACFEVECAPDEFCRDGACVAVGCDPACASAERCVEGTCLPDPCAGIDCANDQVCDPTSGECVADLCFDVECLAGRVCQQSTGDCVADPCALISCPARSLCEVQFDGTATCRELKGDFVVALGSGCGCRASGGEQALGWLLLVAMGWLGLRGRRRRPGDVARG